MRRLYTFRISHFSEKARWALDLQGLPYEESTLLPGPHGHPLGLLLAVVGPPDCLHAGLDLHGRARR